MIPGLSARQALCREAVHEANVREVLLGLRHTADAHATLRDYQVDGALWAYEQYIAGRGGVLADFMGFGKTVQLRGLAELLVADARVLGPMLVCANSPSAIKQTAKELAAWGRAGSHVAVHRHHGKGGDAARATGIAGRTACCRAIRGYRAWCTSATARRSWA